MATGGTLVLNGHTRHVHYAAFSEDGERVVNASRDRTVKMWSASTGELLWSGAHHDGFVFFASFVVGDSKVITGSSDNTACILDAASGSLLERLA